MNDGGERTESTPRAGRRRGAWGGAAASRTRARWVTALPPNPRLTSCAPTTSFYNNLNELFCTVVEPMSKHLTCFNIVVPVNAVRELFGDAQQQQLTPHIVGCVERVLAILIAHRHYDADDAINAGSDDALQRALETATHSLAGDESLADVVQTHETAQNFQDDYVARRVNNTMDMLYTITPSDD